MLQINKHSDSHRQQYLLISLLVCIHQFLAASTASLTNDQEGSCEPTVLMILYRCHEETAVSYIEVWYNPPPQVKTFSIPCIPVHAFRPKVSHRQGHKPLGYPLARTAKLEQETFLWQKWWTWSYFKSSDQACDFLSENQPTNICPSVRGAPVASVSISQGVARYLRTVSSLLTPQITQINFKESWNLLKKKTPRLKILSTIFGDEIGPGKRF